MSHQILAGLPAQAPGQQFLSDLAIRSGLLNLWGWSPPMVAELTKMVSSLLDSGELVALPDEKYGLVFLNTGCKLSSEHRICLSPAPVKHAAKNAMSVLSRDVITEMEALSQVQWIIQPAMLRMIENLEFSPLEALVKKSPKFVSAAKEAAESPHFHIPIVVDAVKRFYGEGILSYTGDKMTRACLAFAKKVKYTPRRVKEICKLIEFNPSDSPMVLEHHEHVLTNEGVKGFNRINNAVWVKHATERGESGAATGVDMRTFGQLLAAIVAGDLNLLHDCSVYGDDSPDCRQVIASRILTPASLMPWVGLTKSKDIAKPLIMQLFYGQSASNGAASLLWENAEEAPVGWISSFGAINETVCMKNKKLFNTDTSDIVTALGVKAAFRSFCALSESYNSSFWRSYPDVLVLRQRLTKAFEHQKANTHGPASSKMTVTAPNGSTFVHTKWELDLAGPKTRFRYKGPGAASHKHGIDITMASMVDVAGGHALFVRLIHFFDAWFRNRVSLRLIKLQKQRHKAVMLGVVHDNWIIPFADIPHMHRIVRAVLHEAVDKLPGIVNKILTDNGQDAMPPIKNLRKVHQSIARNHSFLHLS